MIYIVIVVSVLLYMLTTFITIKHYSSKFKKDDPVDISPNIPEVVLNDKVEPEDDMTCVMCGNMHIRYSISATFMEGESEVVRVPHLCGDECLELFHIEHGDTMILEAPSTFTLHER